MIWVVMTHVILKLMGLQPPTLISSLFLQHLTSRPCLQELSKQLHYEGVGEKSRPIDLAAGSLALIFLFVPKNVVSRLHVANQKMMLHTFHIYRYWQLKSHFYPWKKIIQFDEHIFADGLVQPPTHQLRPRYLQIQMPREKVTEKDEDDPTIGGLSATGR